jgi:glycosyltransferase involved in cell wall biosynthesis
LKVAILGTRGIPNNYGGFEQFAEYLSLGLVNDGHEVYVYSPHNHAYKQDTWKGVNVIFKFDPEYKVGTVGQFVYDLNCVLDSRKREFDLILQLGYTSSSIWNFLFPKSTLVFTNMDGLEWKRTKYGKSTQKFLKFAEKLAVKKSDFLISDSLGIKNYLENEYRVDSTYIPYGAWVFDQPNNEVLSKYNLKPYAYDMLIARLEPENSIEIILEGFANAKTERVFVVIGNNKTNYGNFLTEKFSSQKNIIFLGSIYEMDTVNNLRYFSNLYFHGHTVGGTNPSLLEAMASNALIAANKNDFNEAILENEAYYFNTPEEVSSIVETVIKNPTEEVKLELNIIKIRTLYSWNIIIEKYEKLFLTALQNKK